MTNLLLTVVCIKTPLYEHLTIQHLNNTMKVAGRAR